VGKIGEIVVKGPVVTRAYDGNEAETRLAALTPTGVQESDEVYLLSGAGDIGGLAARLPEMLRQGGRG